MTLLLVGVGIVAILLYVFPIWQGLYRSCLNVVEGMNEQDVTEVMRAFVADGRTVVGITGKGSLPYLPPIEYEEGLMFTQNGLLDEYQCNIYFVNDEVVFVQRIFD